MANNPQGPGPQGSNDPAGNTQMFRAFVDEQQPARQQAAAKSGPSVGLIIGIVLAVVVVAGVAWLALK
ncbi:hypothetical protein ACFV9W_12505 [Streptomyces sp. NPDC059897]|uniref:hypothetical protein n=1 Tax=Streptomyces sp. NPDC059897 TaxID=3346994 RepID=UPI003662A76F